jgi:hypothetical protein
MLGGSSCCGSATTGGATKTKNRVVKPKKKVVKKIKGGNTDPEPKHVTGTVSGNVTGGAKKTKNRVVKPKKIVKKYGKRKGGYTEEDKEPGTDPVTDTDTDPVTDTEENIGGAKKKKGYKVGVKRVLTPYNKFVKKNFAIMKKKFPNEKAPQIMQKVAIEWKIFKNK